MFIDPRTGCPVTQPTNCHLIPACFGGPNKTIRLDRAIDNAVGSYCDSQLFAFFQCFVGESLNVNFVFDNGSATIKGRISPTTKQFWIQKPKGGDTQDWLRRALGAREAQVRIRECFTPAVLMKQARMSMVNSAMLILADLKRPEVFGPGFDTARRMLSLVQSGNLDQADLAEIEEMTPVIGSILIEREKLKGTPQVELSEIRRFYDPQWDPGDNLLDDFPRNCVTEQDGYLIVRLPYGKCLRGTARFPLIA